MSKLNDDGGAAFPVPYAIQTGGMSLRDYFAAKAMPYQISIEMRPYEDYNFRNAAKRAYEIADAMIAAREL